GSAAVEVLGVQPHSRSECHLRSGSGRANRQEVPAEKREKLVQEKQIQNVPLALGVRQLRLTNCIALPSKAIIDVTRRCYNLRELYCVAEPYELFRHLCRLQQCTKKVEWTLYDRRRCRYVDSLDVWPIERLHEGMGPCINDMYVDQVLCDETVAFLSSFLKRCRQLYHLHEHNVCVEYYPELNADAGSANFLPDKHGALEVTDHLHSLHAFEYTCKMPLSPSMDTPLPVIRNNIAWQRKPAPWFNVVRSEDGLKEGKGCPWRSGASHGRSARQHASRQSLRRSSVRTRVVEGRETPDSRLRATRAEREFDSSHRQAPQMGEIFRTVLRGVPLSADETEPFHVPLLHRGRLLLPPGINIAQSTLAVTTAVRCESPALPRLAGSRMQTARESRCQVRSHRRRHGMV
ncbi:hypothetical protein MTO96_044919, partial [Rhipicephalus appendiculatus]